MNHRVNILRHMTLVSIHINEVASCDLKEAFIVNGL